MGHLGGECSEWRKYKRQKPVESYRNDSWICVKWIKKWIFPLKKHKNALYIYIYIKGFLIRVDRYGNETPIVGNDFD